MNDLSSIAPSLLLACRLLVRAAKSGSGDTGARDVGEDADLRLGCAGAE